MRNISALHVYLKRTFVTIGCSLLLLVLAAAANGETFQTIVNNGSSANRVDIAILGDGYTAGELNLYHTNVQAFIQSVFAQEPYNEYRNYYNVHMIDVVSEQSGADHSDRTPQVFVNTALDAAYNCSNIQRLICVNTGKVNQVISRTLAAGQFDVILVMVNDLEYGGSGGSVAVASVHPSAVELILHEVGHSFAQLADEYTGGGPSCNPNVEPPAVNSTRATVREQIEWKHWIDASTPIPTTTQVQGLPGLYEGSSYCTLGLYRPTYQSKMNILGRPFEQINTEQHVRRIYNFVSPIDSSSPAGTSITVNNPGGQLFSVSTPSPLTHTLSITWQVDGQTAGTGTSFFLGGHLTPGAHTVTVSISDSTPFVRSDPQNLLSESKQWNLNVVGNPAPPTRFDYDGDGRADLSMRRPADDNWYIRRTTAGFTIMTFGVAGDRMVPADYDGDGKTDVAMFRPSNGTWYMFNSQSQSFSEAAWGQDGDLPAPADHDGDGKADLVVFRPSTGMWYVKRANNTISQTQFGTAEDKPVIGDFDGDGKFDIGVFRASDNNWYTLRTTEGFWIHTWAQSGDNPVPADYDGDGETDIAVFRPSTGQWYRILSSSGFDVKGWGQAGDKPVPADYDGDSKADVGIFRPSDGTWYIVGSSSGQIISPFGSSDDIPTQSAFIY